MKDRQPRIYSRREALTLLGGVAGALFVGCTPRRSETTGVLPSVDSPRLATPTLDLPAHPTPSSQEIAVPQDLIVLSDETHKSIILEGYPEIELFFGGDPDSENDPFIISISPSAVRQTIDQLKQEGNLLEGEKIRFVFFWPGDVMGPVYDCVDEAVVNIIMIPLARPIYDHVYQRYFSNTGVITEEEKKRFQTLASNQANLVIWHELEHHRHCRDGQDNVQIAEVEAIQAEYRRATNSSPIIYLELKPNIDVEKAIRYFEIFLQ